MKGMPIRLKGGGHGQEAMDFMDKNSIKYNVVKTYNIKTVCV